jgi:hypothetical protein
MSLKESFLNSKSEGKLTGEQKLKIASQESLRDSVRILKEIKNLKIASQNDINFCLELRSALLLRNLRRK